MAVKSSSKQKLLSLIDVFEKLTDENNVISTNEIVEELAKRGITAERKSIYADIALLVENGYDIKFGARPLKRAIRSLLEDKLAKLALTGKITENAQITADADGEEITLTVN